MRAGKLDRAITIQSFTSVLNEYGTPVPTWTDVGTIRAQIITSNTEEFLTNGASDESIIIFRTRYLPGVSNSSRVLYDGGEFNVREVKELARRKGLELRCERRVAA
ncbi:phage head closure protein [Agrobacterium tumefaciens]|uniref:phage head closure protein n=1 Tax=Agrobacterium tumefaciens TaxID=358 RepID=UPI00080FAD01|nr:phage head closure protein [Agrobacterium tumefaciens]NSL22842.1 phage head closure protein [Agrobacterium tumefaciens]NTC56771.1 phage head closure protein [Agrobacterium tumefaciens]NTC62575.1 phage head closure protein [Agrobacterium tumefaciens]NTC66305.1 phage head closure protein [Agrobacterium tumefaciens]NTC74885.1 phage head closure protein [Agrobacterium tumefaciens]